MGRWARGVALVAVLQLGGCAALFSERVGSDYEPSVAPSCSTAGVTLDGFFAVGYGLLALTGLASGEGSLIAVGLLGGGLHGLSIHSGYTNTDECKDAKEEHAAYLNRQAAENRLLNDKLLEQESKLLERLETDANTDIQAVEPTSDSTNGEDVEPTIAPTVAAPTPPVLKMRSTSDSKQPEKHTKPVASEDDEDWQDFWTVQKP